MGSQDSRDGGAAVQEEVPYIAVILSVRAFPLDAKYHGDKPVLSPAGCIHMQQCDADACFLFCYRVV